MKTENKRYNQLSLEERERLYGFWLRGLSLRKIAGKLKRNVSTVSRELGRHTKYGRSYLPCKAQKEFNRISVRQRRRAALKNPLIFLYVRKHLRKGVWSPETIAGRLSLDHPGQSICHESIYRYIYLNPRTRKDKLWRFLELHRRKRMKKDGRKVKAFCKLPEAIPIQDRPEIINNRSEIGHWETDNMEGVKSDKTAISVTVERVIRKTKLAKLGGHKANVKTKAVIDNLNQEKKTNPNLVKSITFDRGPENSGYKEIGEKLNIQTYGCNPYHSWEKGTVENMNKRIRRFFPKGQSIDWVTQKDLDIVEEILNNTPRKILGFLTPNEYSIRIQQSGFIP